MAKKIEIKLNRKEMENKILGCWIGKNIGGTIGYPYEGEKSIQDVKGFATEKGNPLPNDDLDIQLIWLQAMCDVGPKALTANTLADYWLSCVTPHWNEYGNARANLNTGLLPPLSGEVDNDEWKISNGAWIRSEIWACLAPGLPNVAAKYAIMDATIDHGLSDGTYAEIFTASLESLAFFETDIRALIEKSLTFIPKESRIAKSVRMVLEGYDKKLPWQEVREKLVKESVDIGWFQAPANVAYVVLGLMYGEGDFKKSMIHAVNCGDDTDCTAATCGSILGIMMGADKIPQDWQEYIGDSIVHVCINASYKNPVPKTCTELTQKVLDLIPEVMSAYDIKFEYVDGENEINLEETKKVLEGYSQRIFKRSPYSFEMTNMLHTDVIIEYDKEPRVKPNSDFKIKFTLSNRRRDARHCYVKVMLPEGWSADYDRCVYVPFNDEHHNDTGINMATYEMVVHVGEKVDATNDIVVSFSNSAAHAVPMLVPVVLLG